MLEDSEDSEEIIERVAALDIGKAELVACVRVPNPDRPGRRAQEITAYSTMTRSLLGLAEDAPRDPAAGAGVRGVLHRSPRVPVAHDAGPDRRGQRGYRRGRNQDRGADHPFLPGGRASR
jgi:hypothetical protein